MACSLEWSKIGALCSLKAIALACFLAPATVVVPTTPALAQFIINIPGFGGGFHQGRRYGGRHSRHSRYSRRGRRGGEEPGEVSPPPSTGSTSSPGAVTPSSTPSSTPSATAGPKKFRGTTD